MSSLRPASSAPSPRRPRPGRALVTKVVATILAGVVVLFAMNTLQSDSDSASGTQVSTSSLLTLPAADEPEPPNEIPTTAPLQLPTSTAIAAPAPTAAPTATAAPEPTATALPPATAVPPAPTAVPPREPAPAQPATERAVESAPAEVVADPTATLVPAPEATATLVPAPEPTATVVPAQAPTTAAPTPVSVLPEAPETVETATVEVPEPTTPPEPTATAIPVQTTADLEFYVLGEINDVRAQAGLAPLALDPSISEISRDWSRQMAEGGFFDHRPGTELNSMLPAGWRRWGENIASAPDIFWAQSSLENSPGHYANMVGEFTHVGIGVYRSGGQVWLTQNFAQY